LLAGESREAAMSPRSRRLLWLAPALSLALGAVTTALAASIPAEQLPREDRLDVLDVLFALGFVAYAAVGALITAAHPRNAVGWLFCAVGLALPVTGLLWTYATYSIEAGSGGLPADEAAAWAFAWSSDPLLIAVVLLLLLFPDGRFMSRAWRMVGHRGSPSCGCLPSPWILGPCISSIASPIRSA